MIEGPPLQVPVQEPEGRDNAQVDTDVERQQAINNASLSELFQRFSVKQPQLRCRGDKPAERVCTDPRCEKNSLLCSSTDCEPCKRDHLKCVSLMLQGLTMMLTDREDFYKQFIRKVFDIEQKLIREIQEKRRNIINEYIVGDLEQEHKDLIEELYFGDNRENIVGRRTHKLNERLRQERQVGKELQKTLLDLYSTQTDKMITEFNALQKRVLDSYITARNRQPEPEFQIDSKILTTNQIAMVESDWPKYSQSCIMAKHARTLIQQMNDEQTKFIKSCFDRKVQRTSLLFRASEHKFEAAKFHQKCDNVQHTLVIIRSNYGKTFGGYTPIAWNASSSDYANDPSGSSFIFSVDLKQKYKIKAGGANSIYCSSSHGPTFGGGQDIRIQSGTAATGTHSAVLPNSYEGHGRERNQSTYTAFCGSPTDSYFYPIEYEVYKVEFAQ